MDSNNFFWSSIWFYGVLNVVLVLVVVDLILGDVFIFLEVYVIGLVILDYLNLVGFVDLYEVVVNEELYLILFSFNYGDIIFD